MTARDFAFWLDGYFELLDKGKVGTDFLTPEQTQCIKNHLALVFRHELDPSFGNAEKQKELNDIHGKDILVRC